MLCIYKLLMGIVAKRYTWWSNDSGILSPEQKRVRPTKGCYKHTYVLKLLVGQARRNKKELSLAWLNICNALEVSLMLQFLPPLAILTLLITNAYGGASVTIKTPDGCTCAIPIQAGVKQGCPLSPILLNLSIELNLHCVKEVYRPD